MYPAFIGSPDRGGLFVWCVYFSVSLLHKLKWRQLSHSQGFVGLRVGLCVFHAPRGYSYSEQTGTFAEKHSSDQAMNSNIPVHICVFINWNKILYLELFSEVPENGKGICVDAYGISFKRIQSNASSWPFSLFLICMILYSIAVDYILTISIKVS